jgi:hypothetical protein
MPRAPPPYTLWPKNRKKPLIRYFYRLALNVVHYIIRHKNGTTGRTKKTFQKDRPVKAKLFFSNKKETVLYRLFFIQSKANYSRLFLGPHFSITSFSIFLSE